MGRYLGPRKKLERRFGLIEDDRKEKPKKRKTDYGIRLEEKQKVKFIYGVAEKQFKKYVSESMESGNPSEELMRKLETRLDNVVFKLGFAPTVQAARQLVSHGHIRIDGKKVDIPSFHVQVGQTLKLDRTIADNPKLKEAWAKQKSETPAWLHRDGNEGKIMNLPKAKEMRQDIDTSLIFEFYSK